MLILYFQNITHSNVGIIFELMVYTFFSLSARIKRFIVKQTIVLTENDKLKGKQDNRLCLDIPKDIQIETKITYIIYLLYALFFICLILIWKI